MIDRLRRLLKNRFRFGESKRSAGGTNTRTGQSVAAAGADLLQRLLESRFLTAILSPLSRLIGTERLQRHRGLAVELLQRLREGRIGLGMQLYIGIGGAVVITLSASLVAWFSFNQVGDSQNRVNEDSIPEMTAAFGVARQAGTLVAAAPRLVTAATPVDFTGVAAAVAKERTDFETRLQALTPREGEEETVSRVLAHGSEIISNIGAIRDSVSQSFVLSRRSEELLTKLETLQDELTRILVPAVDDHLFYALTGYRNLGQRPASPARHFSKSEFNRYRHMIELQAHATTATQLLAGVTNLTEIPLIEPVRERFESARDGIGRSLVALGRAPLRDRITPVFDQLLDLGLGEQNGFDLRAEELGLANRQRDLLERNRRLSVDLVAEVEGMVGSASARAQDAALSSTQAILTGRRLLLVLNLVSISGAVLIGWLFVGRILLRRLKNLSDRMRGMAGGDLEARVEISGRDEVAEMAAALEVFRRHALEVQRLNLVEKLAEELKGKNSQLEKAMDDLRKAQDQIVMRDKLAELGQLTAGVAHEIKNPLNFVKNFSEVSEELMEELGEVLTDNQEKLSKDDRELIEEISGDLTGNLKSIRHHGDRANRVIHDMLSMGRGSGERQPTDINGLLDQSARLAYHSARATDQSFNLDIKQDLDPQIDTIDVVSQDVGRVFLNLVSNACYATDEKRRSLGTDGGEPADGEGEYSPTLWLSTKRLEDRIEIRVRDNGSGIPAEVVDKIFNPFFTTKPTNEGTGLGLALSNDIVREHGGAIKVETEPGSFTEMLVELPLESPAAMAVQGDADEEDDEPVLSGGESDRLESSDS